MQIYYMRKNKIPIPVSTLVLMIVTVTYKSVLVVIGLFVAFFQRGFVHRYLEGILPGILSWGSPERWMLYCHVRSGVSSGPGKMDHDEMPETAGAIKNSEVQAGTYAQAVRIYGSV